MSYKNECAKRARANARQRRQTVLLYFGDLDPSGWEMLPSMLRTLQEEMALGDWVHGVRCALTPSRGAPSAPQEPRRPQRQRQPRPEVRQRFGDLAVELDALPPAVLERLVAASIKSHLDMSAFEVEVERQVSERQEIDHLQGRVRRFILENGGAA